MSAIPINPETTLNKTPPAATPKPPTADPLASKDTFLKLLVAQIRNQNPLSPADGIQFISQLAEFSSLEQSLAMRQDLDAIKAALDAQAKPPVSPVP